MGGEGAGLTVNVDSDIRHRTQPPHSACSAGDEMAFRQRISDRRREPNPIWRRP
jgi:hypothetical protein